MTLQFLRGAVVVARVVTARDGTFRIALRNGVYVVRTGTTLRFGSGLVPKTVRVPLGRWMRQNFSIDTGIR